MVVCGMSVGHEYSARATPQWEVFTLGQMYTPNILLECGLC